MAGVFVSSFLGLAAVAAGCGGGADGAGGAGGGGAPIASQPLSGKIDGVPWTFLVGETDAFLSSSDPTFFTNLYDTPLDVPCVGGIPSASERALIINIPKAVGSYTLSFTTGGLTATFTYKQNDPNNDYQNDIATSGRLDVTALTATTLTGDARITFDADNFVEGQFQVAICPS
jgi:hypothetical protein